MVIVDRRIKFCFNRNTMVTKCFEGNREWINKSIQNLHKSLSSEIPCRNNQASRKARKASFLKNRW